MPRFFNTLTRKIEELRPIESDKVKIYTCGPTVYDFAHIGNLRAYIFSDLLKRTLLYDSFKVTHVMNITDVGHLTGDRDMGEDKLEKSAREKKKSAWEIASYYTDAFLRDLKTLNILMPDRLPKATDHIKEMIALIGELEKKGFTYRTSDGIYFDTSKLPDYGKLARLDIEGLKEGARVEINAEKKNLTDFSLWKFSPKEGQREMEWQSPWGVGFPGWHIECSAMSAKYLGQPFDIHTGGIDHIPVHHTNEIAQSEAAFDKPLANLWMHSEFMMVDGKRMGKSEGNLITLEEVQKRGLNPLAYRYFVLQGHYRTKLNFTWEAMNGAQNSLHNLYLAVAESKKIKGEPNGWDEKFKAAIDNDLNTSEALAVIWEMLKSGEKAENKFAALLRFDKVLGLSIAETWEKLQQPIPEEIKKLADHRETLRKEKNWAEADKLREEIENSGYHLSDTEKGTVFIPKL